MQKNATQFISAMRTSPKINSEQRVGCLQYGSVKKAPFEVWYAILTNIQDKANKSLSIRNPLRVSEYLSKATKNGV